MPKTKKRKSGNLKHEPSMVLAWQCTECGALCKQGAQPNNDWRFSVTLGIMQHTGGECRAALAPLTLVPRGALR